MLGMFKRPAWTQIVHNMETAESILLKTEFDEWNDAPTKIVRPEAPTSIVGIKGVAARPPAPLERAGQRGCALSAGQPGHLRHPRREIH